MAPRTGTCTNCRETRPIPAKGLCWACYQWQHRTGTPRDPRRPAGGQRLALPTRLMRHVRFADGGHWLWTGHIAATGYGRIYVEKQSLYVHRVAYETFVGPIPADRQIDHLCRVRACFNPRHLEPVTPRENQLRAPESNTARTSCRRGHPFSEENTHRHNGRRFCRACRREYMRVYVARKRPDKNHTVDIPIAV